MGKVQLLSIILLILSLLLMGCQNQNIQEYQKEATKQTISKEGLLNPYLADCDDYSAEWKYVGNQQIEGCLMCEIYQCAFQGNIVRNKVVRDINQCEELVNPVPECPYEII